MSESGLRYIDPPVADDRIIAYEITGSLTTEDMTGILDRIELVTGHGKKARLCQIMDGFDGFEIGVVIEKFKRMGTLWHGIERYAVVSDSKAYRFAVEKIADAVTPMDLKAFEPDQREEAFAWLLADDDAEPA